MGPNIFDPKLTRLACLLSFASLFCADFVGCCEYHTDVRENLRLIKSYCNNPHDFPTFINMMKDFENLKVGDLYENASFQLGQVNN